MSEEIQLSYALVVVGIFHLMVIFGISFNAKENDSKSMKNLEVIIVKNRLLDKAPEKADFIAQSNQQGGGKTEHIIKPKAPNAPPAFDPTEETVPTFTQQQQNIMDQKQKEAYLTQQKAQYLIEKTQVSTDPTQYKAQNKHKVTASIEREIIRLSAALDKTRQINANKPRRKIINASTKESIYAEYLEQWRKKIERIGNLHYPELAKQRQLFGHLILHVAIKSNGQIRSVRIIKSSGHQILDNAAMRIVREAAPFPPFPNKIRQKIDILDINRTWSFKKGNRLSADK